MKYTVSAAQKREADITTRLMDKTDENQQLLKEKQSLSEAVDARSSQLQRAEDAIRSLSDDMDAARDELNARARLIKVMLMLMLMLHHHCHHARR